jgi:hypothetical protein
MVSSLAKLAARPGAEHACEVAVENRSVLPIEEWIEREARYISLDAAVQRPEGVAWVGRERALTELDRQFLECPLADVTGRVLEEWPRAQEAPRLLPDPAPEFGALFSEIEEVGCLWPAESGDEVGSAFVVRRRNPTTGESLFLIFEPGVSAGAVVDFEREVGIALPDELRAFYCTFGYIQADGPALNEGLIGLRSGVGVEAVLGARCDWLEWCKEVGEEDDIDASAFEDYLPLYANGLGDYVVWLGRNREEREPQVWLFSHDTLEMHRCSPTIPRFWRELISRVYLGEEEAFELDL